MVTLGIFILNFPLDLKLTLAVALNRLSVAKLLGTLVAHTQDLSNKKQVSHHYPQCFVSGSFTESGSKARLFGEYGYGPRSRFLITKKFFKKSSFKKMLTFWDH
jgi:hypothetical protein